MHWFPPPICNCEKSRTYIDHLACLRLFAFLMGLNEVYAHARSQILMLNPLPSVSKAYAMIMADESQRLTASSHVGNNVPEQIALYAGKSNVYNVPEQMALYVGKDNVSKKFQA